MLQVDVNSRSKAFKANTHPDAIGFEIHDRVCDGVRDDCRMEWGVHVELPKISFLKFRLYCSTQLLHAVTRAAASLLPTNWALCSLYVTLSHSLFVMSAFSQFTSVFACKHVLACGTKRRSAWERCWAERKMQAEEFTRL